MSKTVRIGCASAFYGDSQLAARQLVDGGDIQYLVFDYLAEATMAILARAKAKNENYGFAVDFVTVAMRDVLADCAAKGIKVVANAGGVNVPACIAGLEKLCEAQGLKLKIAGVYGDDLSNNSAALAADLSESNSGQPLPNKLASINAYLGARPIADALDAGADVVVTGRVVDSAVVLGPLMHEFAWSETDYDQLAQGSLAGHVIECGAQCAGGNFTDWQQVPDFSTMSYPVADVAEDGSFIVDIPPNTGGMVNLGTVGEQILYEIGDPANYLLPDVACDFSNVQLQQVAKDRVRVSNAKGRSPGNQYKVCATWVDGYRLMGSAFMGGLRGREKALASLNAWVSRCQGVFAEKGWGDFRQVCLEVVGAEHTYGPHAQTLDVREVMAKYGLHHDNKDALMFAAMEMAYLATSGTPGMSGFGAGRPKSQPLMRVHSALIDKSLVPVKVQLAADLLKEQCYETAAENSPVPAASLTDQQRRLDEGSSKTLSVSLERLAFARSGDKGDSANIGVMARKPEYLPYIAAQLTEQRVAEYFAHVMSGTVSRYELPGMNALNFLLTEALGGGGTASLRLDAQGKAYGQMLLSLDIEIPEHLL